MFEEEPEPEFEIFSALLFNSLKAITFMFFISFAMINEPADEGKIDPKAEVVVTFKDDNTITIPDPKKGALVFKRKFAPTIPMPTPALEPPQKVDGVEAVDLAVAHVERQPAIQPAQDGGR